MKKTEKNNYENIWMISDIHFGLHAVSLKWLDLTEQYFNDFFIPLLKKNKTDNDALFVLGDIFDNRININSLALNLMINIFQKIATIMPIEIIVGNHDIAYKTKNEVNSVNFLGFIDNINVHINPTQILTQNKHLTLIPWCKDNDTFLTNVNKFKNNDYVFCHHDFTGLHYSKNIIVEDGIVFNDLINVNQMFSGHIHTRQSQKGLTMIGNPFHQTRNDIGNDKGIYRLNVNSGKTKFFKNNKSPQFKVLHLDEYFNKPYNEFQKDIKNNMVDIIINKKYQNIFAWDDFNKLIEGSNDIKFILTDDELTSIYTMEENINKFKVDKELNKYINALEQPPEIKKLLKEKIKDLYDSAVIKGKT